MNVSANYETDQNLRTRQGIWAYGAGAPLVDRVLDLAAVAETATTVDVGCGNGGYLARLRQRGHRGSLLGVDLSPGMAAKAGAASGATTAVADVQFLPLRTGVADLTLAPHMLYHVPDIPLAIAEIRRITAPSGRAVIVTNTPRHAYEVHAMFAGVTADLLGRAATIAWDGPRFRSDQAEELLPAAFDVVERHDLGRVSAVPAAAAVSGYVGSLPPDALGVPADRRAEVLAELERRVAAHIAAHGSFEVTSGAVAFVCR
ncbi:class I SAM-dependent methyltransferase [Asanoa sp. WMMD1127]|uniref:class I SAM-dependent methyltransferase n=1 Tax=Asanoa sp. WMMD1127 TaxID=3016107 RepID=UPI002417C56A|nr:class I SAM-dependent methyltransferase [Asanoa sp. WMMD1127]MDG4821188.1 class I SAM-dependent methyltransferase [Asanoa sp. WMMD1127]